MDMSKLPRLSKTNASAPGPDASDVRNSPNVQNSSDGENAGQSPEVSQEVSQDQSSEPAPRESNAAPMAARTPVDYRGGPPTPGLGIGPEIWFNTVVGLILIFLGKTFARYLFCRLTGKPFDSGIVFVGGDQDGQPVPYSQVQGFQMISDAGIFLFGVIVLLEAAVKTFFSLGFRVPNLAVLLAIWLAIFSTIFNVYVCVKVMSSGLLPLLPGLAVAFGGYIIADLWRTYVLQKQFGPPGRKAAS